MLSSSASNIPTTSTGCSAVAQVSTIPRSVAMLDEVNIHGGGNKAANSTSTTLDKSMAMMIHPPPVPNNMQWADSHAGIQELQPAARRNTSNDVSCTAMQSGEAYETHHSTPHHIHQPGAASAAIGSRKILRDLKKLEAKQAEEKYIEDLESENQNLTGQLQNAIPKRLAEQWQNVERLVDDQINNTREERFAALNSLEQRILAKLEEKLLHMEEAHSTKLLHMEEAHSTKYMNRGDVQKFVDDKLEQLWSRVDEKLAETANDLRDRLVDVERRFTERLEKAETCLRSVSVEGIENLNIHERSLKELTAKLHNHEKSFFPRLEQVIMNNKYSRR